MIIIIVKFESRKRIRRRRRKFIIIFNMKYFMIKSSVLFERRRRSAGDQADPALPFFAFFVLDEGLILELAILESNLLYSLLVRITGVSSDFFFASNSSLFFSLAAVCDF
jgi:hypothetical protein